jgi:superfamily II DNA or RNA helicase
VQPEPRDANLRPYQIEAIASIEMEWERIRSTLLVLATGLGKTRTAAEVARRNRQRGRILWLAHREELLTQAAEAMMAHAGLTTELERAESKAIIHELMGGADVVVASVATMHAARLRRWPAGSFGTIIVDEAHHATARGYRGVLSHFASAKVLGLTATPDRSDRVGLHNVFESCAFTYGILDGIRGGYLSPIRAQKVMCGDLDLSAVRTSAGDLSAGDLERAMQVEGVIHQIASPLVELAGSRQTIAFCPTVAIAEELARVLAGYVGAGRVATISGSTDRETRKQILAAYTAGRVQFITNCAVLTEGFDAPATSCVAMCRPTKSRSLYTQCVGRGLRLAEGKSDCLLLDFIAKNRDPDLIGPVDVLDGAALPLDVRDAAERLLTAGGAAQELTDAIEKAREEEAKREAQRERQRRAARLKIAAPWAVRDMEVFAAHAELAEYADEHVKRAAPWQREASEKQRALLEQYGIALPEKASAQSASNIIDEAFKRGLATIKQARTLAKAGINPSGMTKREASEAIDALARSGWRATPELIARYRRAS